MFLDYGIMLFLVLLFYFIITSCSFSCAFLMEMLLIFPLPLFFRHFDEYILTYPLHIATKVPYIFPYACKKLEKSKRPVMNRPASYS